MPRRVNPHKERLRQLARAFIAARNESMDLSLPSDTYEARQRRYVSAAEDLAYCAACQCLPTAEFSIPERLNTQMEAAV
jgi:hypothetical protein